MTVLGWLKEWRRAKSPHRKSAPVEPRRRRPRPEALEDRLAPAVLTVTLVGDTGFGSLRERIGTANSGDTINFSTALNNQTILLASALTINKDLTINGQDTNGNPLNITLSGNNATRIFSVTTGTSTLFNLTLTTGKVTGDKGGAILVANGATLNVATDTFTGNKAIKDTNNNGGLGGAIENLGTLSVTASMFTNNSDDFAGGAISSQATGTQTLSLSGTTFDKNSAGTLGGAIYTTNNTSLLGDTFNDGGGANSAGTSGGAIFAGGPTPATTRLTVATSIFGPNTATSAGGAIYSSDAYTSIQTSSFISNTATRGGGGIYFDVSNEGSPATAYDATFFLNQDTFTSNTAGSTGGAVFIDVSTNAGTVSSTITNSTFYMNTAVNGGGVQLSQNTTANGAANATLINDTFFQNIATTHGGGLALALTKGGALLNTVAMTSLTVYKNTAGTDSGGLYGDAAQAGSISINNSIFDQNVVTAVGYMGPIDVTLSNNAALNDLGWNLVGLSNVVFKVQNNDILNNNAGLSNTLAANGALPGFPQTLALQLGSPAYRAGDNTLAGKPNPFNIDERGLTRQANKVSIGAYDPDATAVVQNGAQGVGP